MPKERRPWSKLYDADYLADSTMNKLTPSERGIVHILWPLLRTQTDEPGVFVKNGVTLDLSGVARLVKPHCTGGGVRLDIVSKWVSTVLQIGPFKQRESDGAWFSPRIMQEAKEHEKLSTYGRKGAEKRYTQEPHYNGVTEQSAIANPIATPIGIAEQSIAEQSRSISTNVVAGLPPRAHTNTPVDIDLMVDYQTEVLNKLEGVTTQTERKDRGSLLKIARHVPPSIIKRALQDTQDTHQRGDLGHGPAYFSSRIVTLCVHAGIRSPFAPEQKGVSHA